ncbi:MAG: ribulose-phosphate 3-epimerase [Candidatus Cloacimonadia bacterium]
MKPKIFPSILSADFLNLGNEIHALEEAGADGIHLDVMDGHFVPNLTIGPTIVKQVRNTTNLPLEVHLMIINPADFIDRFIEAGADAVSFHIELSIPIVPLLRKIKQKGAKAGVAINPETPIEEIYPILDYVDYVIVMTVHPGFGGQQYIDGCTPNIRQLYNIREDRKFEIAVDGGINYQTGKKAREAGADILISGDFIFRSSDYKKCIDGLRNV